MSTKSTRSISPTRQSGTVTLAHGSGGRAMQKLIRDLFLSRLDHPQLHALEDQARLEMAPLMAMGDRLAFTTDSYVVDPLVFPGGDIGKLAVCGTVNDLAVGGARPVYLSCGFIMEEGLDLALLEQVVDSLAHTAEEAGVAVVTGDTKVVPRGAADKLFINTAGIGVIPQAVVPASHRATTDDVVIVSGPIGDHGAAITAAREDLGLHSSIQSDCQPLNALVEAMLAASPNIRCMRDATRGGVATVLNEIAGASAVSIQLDESRLPVADAVQGLCELLGLDPLYLACEGRLVAIVAAEDCDAVLAAMHSQAAGVGASVIGKVHGGQAGRVSMKTTFGGERIVDTLVGEQLPRIC